MAFKRQHVYTYSDLESEKDRKWLLWEFARFFALTLVIASLAIQLV